MPIAKFNKGDRVVFVFDQNSPKRKYSGTFGVIEDIPGIGIYTVRAESFLKETLSCFPEDLVLAQSTSHKPRTYTITLDDDSYIEVLHLIIKYGVESNLSLKSQVAFTTAKVDQV